MVHSQVRRLGTQVEVEVVVQTTDTMTWVFHANMKNFSIEKNLLIYSLDNNNKFTKKHVSYFMHILEIHPLI